MIDAEIRKRLHDLTGDIQVHELKVSLLEQQMAQVESTLATKANNDLVTASMAQVTQTIEHLRGDFLLVRNVVFGFIAIIVISVITALVTGAIHTPTAGP